MEIKMILVCVLIFWLLPNIFVYFIELERKGVCLLYSIPENLKVYHVLGFLFFLPSYIIFGGLTTLYTFFIYPIYKMAYKFGNLTIWSREINKKR